MVPRGSLGLAGGVTGKLTLNPSFNVSIDILPSFRYHRSFGALRDFDGFYFGLGLSASYRLGQDPDAPGTEVRAIRFGEVEMPPVFASMQSVDVNEPVTTLTITNTENSFTDAEVEHDTAYAYRLTPDGFDDIVSEASSGVPRRFPGPRRAQERLIPLASPAALPSRALRLCR